VPVKPFVITKVGPAPRKALLAFLLSAILPEMLAPVSRCIRTNNETLVPAPAAPHRPND
jgi:hypothetical protein